VKLPKIKPAELPAQGAEWADSRFTLAVPIRRVLNKVFPDHWSFMLGEVALYSFLVLLLSGVFLTLFFDPSMGEVTYHGPYARLQGVHMSAAYASSLHLSFEVRGGLIMRQIHHWAALLFMASMLIHMCRAFFTGAFRRPRETTWILGVVLLILGLTEGFAGYSLPDDALSGTGLRIMNAIVLSIPVLGSWVAWAVFGGEFPGEAIISRLYILHVLLVPALILGLIAVHIGLVTVQKHTQWPGRGRTEKNVVGHRMFPGFAARGAGLSLIVFAILAFLGGLFQINPIWLFGPYEAAVVSAGSQPDWYVMWLDGSTRLFPAWEIRAFGYTLSPLFWPTVVLPGVVFTIAALYPFLEARFTKDTAPHNLLERPRDNPGRTAFGAMGLTFIVVLTLSGANDLIAQHFDISLNATTWAGRIGILLLPPLAYYVTHRICLGLQQHDREILAHGVETGIIKRLPSGKFIEVHQPLGEPDEHGHTDLPYLGGPVPKKMNELGVATPQPPGFFKPLEKASSGAQEKSGQH
jgi:ubiquinol-cytochrome c reductase cytochrome b subunit